MSKFNDIQTILLSFAAQREPHSFYPLPDTLKKGARVDTAIAALIDNELAVEHETSDRAMIHRSEGDIGYGVFATSAGLAAIGVVDEAGEGAAAPPEPRTTKTAMLIALLSRDQGATLAELIAATGWLPHTTRAALTGLRKKGYDIERSKRGDQTCYRIESAARV